MRMFLLVLAATAFLLAKVQTIVFAAGCFWGVEKFYDNLEGVIEAKAGYAGGNFPDPTYEKVLHARRAASGVVNYAESVQVRYDDSKISTRKLIESFWELHDPTQGDRQGNDIGNNYRSAIYYTTEEQKRIALETKAIYQRLLKQAGYGTITTEIKPLTRFYEAEAYHQDYLKKHPFGYCPNHATGVTFRQAKASANDTTPLHGKEIVVVTAPHCPFCEAFENDVLKHYRGKLPVRTVPSSALKGYTLSGPIEGTPTILFIDHGKEAARYVGYMDAEAFYRALAAFAFGKDSQTFRIAYEKSTESRFCRKYAKFAHTGDGVFIDKISGEAIFDTRDRFNSGSGWLSFYRALPGTVVEKPDDSYGMHRTEVIAKTSGAHLGHVFNDAPGGKRRFCINANVLEFVPRDKYDAMRKR